MPLTDTAIRNAKPGEKTIKLFDERGLYLEVSPAGGKWWRLKYRFDGKEKRLSWRAPRLHRTPVWPTPCANPTGAFTTAPRTCPSGAR